MNDARRQQPNRRRSPFPMRAMRRSSGRLSVPVAAVLVALGSALLSTLAVWLLGLAGSGSHHLLQILIIVAVPLILAAAWLRSGASSRRDLPSKPRPKTSCARSEEHT